MEKEKPAFKIKAKRKDKTGNYVDVAACWRTQFGSYNVRFAPEAAELIAGGEYWFSLFESSEASDENKAKAKALVGKIAETFEFPG